MTLDDILASLFPAGHDVVKRRRRPARIGTLRSGDQRACHRCRRSDAARRRRGHPAVRLRAGCDRDGGSGPILVLVDSDSQRMSKRDELLGLNEFLAHLAKCLIYADIHGRPTIGILYGHSARRAPSWPRRWRPACWWALPGADPAVMDLPSMAKVTKLPIEVLQEKAKSTPVFAPGLRQSRPDGRRARDLGRRSVPLVDQLEALLADLPDARDRRDALGKERGGRLKAVDIADAYMTSHSKLD